MSGMVEVGDWMLRHSLPIENNVLLSCTDFLMFKSDNSNIKMNSFSNLYHMTSINSKFHGFLTKCF